MKEITYAVLFKIKTPILISVGSTFHGIEKTVTFGKLRLIYPNGKCDYISDHRCASEWIKSCFEEQSLIKTIIRMEKYDRPCNVKMMITKLFLVAEL